MFTSGSISWEFNIAFASEANNNFLLTSKKYSGFIPWESRANINSFFLESHIANANIPLNMLKDSIPYSSYA